MLNNIMNYVRFSAANFLTGKPEKKGGKNGRLC